MLSAAHLWSKPRGRTGRHDRIGRTPLPGSLRGPFGLAAASAPRSGQREPLVWNAGAPSGHAGRAPAQREDAAPIERPHRRRISRQTLHGQRAPLSLCDEHLSAANERPAKRGQQHLRLAGDRDLLSRLCMARTAPQVCPARRSTQVSHARAGETRSRAQTQDSMGDRGHALGDRAVRWSLRGHGCRPSRVIASYPSEVSRRSMNARGVRISISATFASRRSRSPDTSAVAADDRASRTR